LRLEQACTAAIERVAANEAAGIDPDIFAELGEALYWLTALAEANGRKTLPLLTGLRWARNRITHGVVVTAPVQWHYGAELGRLALGMAQLGTTSGHEWLPRTQVPLGPDDRSRPTEEAAYDVHVAGRRVVELLREGLTLAR
jgi:hypothetical protein